MVTAFSPDPSSVDDGSNNVDAPQFESTDTLKAARILKFVTILKLLRNTFEKISKILQIRNCQHKTIFFIT